VTPENLVARLTPSLVGREHGDIDVVKHRKSPRDLIDMRLNSPKSGR
jgi:hypothetical protein